MPKTIVIVSASSGGGHNAAGNAIIQLASRDSNLHAKFLKRIVKEADYLTQLQKNTERFRRSIDYSTFVQRIVQRDR